MSDKKDQIVTCPHCGNKAPQEVINSVSTGSEEIDTSGGIIELETYALIVQCKTCSDVSVYVDWDGNPNPGDLKEAVLVYPVQKKFSGIPNALQDSYDEAKKVQKLSPTAFAVLVRKALEDLCKEQNAKGGNLKEQIDDLAARDIIPKTLSRMANALRYIGNIGAHSSGVKIGSEEAAVMDDFFIAVLEYVYVAPEKLNKLVERLKGKNSLVRKISS